MPTRQTIPLTCIEFLVSLFVMSGSSRRGQPRMTLQTLAVLQAMLASPTSSHYGLELAGAVGFPTGTVYPILARLENAGWVSSTWENADPSEEGRPRRRLYTLTGSGAQAARAALDDGLRLIRPPANRAARTLRPGESLA
jgi:PadR family transcriptional regulator, regulatory protein PadR